MRVVVTGSRHWQDRRTIRAVLLGLGVAEGEGLEIAHGGAWQGADLMADETCKENRYCLPRPVVFRPTKEESDHYRKAAPLARNTRMLKDFAPHLVIAFRAAGKSNGTDDTVQKARLMGIRVWMIEEVAWASVAESFVDGEAT